jgi:arsenate reductase
MRLYGLKTCDTCRKAMKALPGATFVDLRAEGLPEGMLARAHAVFGDRLVNTASTTWRGLSEAERARDPLALLADHPALMKRPLIAAADGTLHLGWGKDVQAALLG